MRKLFGISLSWIDELSRFIMLITVCLGMSIAISNEGHPRMDILSRVLKGNAKKVVLLLADISLAVAMILGANFAIAQEIKTIRNAAIVSTMPFKLWVFFIFIPIGFVGGAIRSLIIVACDILGFLNKDPRATKELSLENGVSEE